MQPSEEPSVQLAEGDSVQSSDGFSALLSQRPSVYPSEESSAQHSEGPLVQPSEGQASQMSTVSKDAGRGAPNHLLKYSFPARVALSAGCM